MSFFSERMTKGTSSGIKKRHAFFHCVWFTFRSVKSSWDCVPFTGGATSVGDHQKIKPSILSTDDSSSQHKGQHEIKVVIGSNAIKAFKTAAKAIVNDRILSIWPLEAANRFHASPTGAHAISRSPVIDMTREKAKRTVIPMMRARSRWADKPATMPALEHLFRRGSLLAHKTRSGILLLTQTRNSSVCFSQWWISSFASIGCTSFEASKARQQWPRTGKGQDPLWFSNMTVYP